MTDKMTAPDLAALSEAATQSEPACNVFAQALVREYRAGRLVLIDDGMRERVMRALGLALSDMDPRTHISELTLADERALADAAIAAILGGEHDK